MPASSCAFQVGTLRCTVLTDGYASYPPPWIFPGVDEARLTQAFATHHMPADRVVVPYTCLLIETGRHAVLVDTGGGTTSPTSGAIVARLEMLGLRPRDIDTVVLTHAHPDHIGGAVNLVGRPTFPSARHILSEAESDFWMAARFDPQKLQLPLELGNSMRVTAQRCLRILRFQLEFTTGETEIAPGVRILPAPGHTPGHLAILVSSEGSHLLNVADAFVHPFHVEEPEWPNGFDHSPAAAVSTRRALLERATGANVHLMAFHFPFPSVGRVCLREGGGYTWTAGW